MVNTYFDQLISAQVVEAVTGACGCRIQHATRVATSTKPSFDPIPRFFSRILNLIPSILYRIGNSVNSLFCKLFQLFKAFLKHFVQTAKGMLEGKDCLYEFLILPLTAGHAGEILQYDAAPHVGGYLLDILRIATLRHGVIVGHKSLYVPGAARGAVHIPSGLVGSLFRGIPHFVKILELISEVCAGVLIAARSIVVLHMQHSRFRAVVAR